jgi:hypothetical protein
MAPGPALDEAVGELEQVSPQARLERLLRAHQVPVGFLSNRSAFRLVVAPEGEASGHITWRWADLAKPAGRPMLGGLYALLLRGHFFGPPEGRLEEVVKQSRRYQSAVSTQLAGQVQEALSRLLEGFQDADRELKGALLGPWLQQAPAQLYEGLLAVLMRLVFILYAEERGLMPEGELYRRHYSVGALAGELEQLAAAGPELLNHGFGAWPRLLALFRMVHDGAQHRVHDGKSTSFLLHMPPREGRLFAPDTFPFLQGYTWDEDQANAPSQGEPPSLGCPRVPDRAVHAVLQALTRLGHERLSYRALDVEQIGAVYEAMMGFQVAVCAGPSVPVEANWPGMKGQKLRLRLDVGALLALPGAKRKAWVEEQGLRWAKGLEAAQDAEAVLACLKKPLGGLEGPGRCYLAPTQKRRATGSHYTPASLTRPIVDKALLPALAALGPKPRPEAILGLKVLDPAMGSGAFLVAATRALAELLVRAWEDHPGTKPALPPHEDGITHARRMVVEGCVYGVDVNPVAVDLAKLSLWLATLAKDQPFTFLDHALRCGDALAGLTAQQLLALHWVPGPPARDWLLAPFSKALKDAASKRQQILKLAGQSTELDDQQELQVLTQRKARLLQEAEAKLHSLQRFADGLVATFFAHAKPKEREAALGAYWQAWRAHFDGATGEPEAPALPPLPEGEGRLRPLHWPLAFPEVFPSAWGSGGRRASTPSWGTRPSWAASPPSKATRRNTCPTCWPSTPARTATGIWWPTSSDAATRSCAHTVPWAWWPPTPSGKATRAPGAWPIY